MKENKIEEILEQKLKETEKEEFGSWKNLLIIIIAMGLISVSYTHLSLGKDVFKRC